ncbi:NepR family anti-sigma factor [Nitrospirillum iridis]|uniref:Anti-sigma factor NepR domain-containing protein n=1 Tax=Nitrospirillum iridis TaxID=765888 RepID=A0A7X0EDN5_9PROT|nr:NepR family anti-sigma factor [Nitrospirillum iridis]MBB6252943.1 hypothetical protein [Nitrospirillum iridis]
MTKQRKPVRRVRPTLTAASAAGVPPGPHDALDQHLREMFDEDAADPVPQDLLDLVDSLDTKHKKRSH